MLEAVGELLSCTGIEELEKTNVYLKGGKRLILGIFVWTLFRCVFSAMKILLICILICFHFHQLSLCQLKKNEIEVSYSLNSSQPVNILSLCIVACSLPL